jgi:hypothetical protein
MVMIRVEYSCSLPLWIPGSERKMNPESWERNGRTYFSDRKNSFRSQVEGMDRVDIVRQNTLNFSKSCQQRTIICSCRRAHVYWQSFSCWDQMNLTTRFGWGIYVQGWFCTAWSSGTKKDWLQSWQVLRQTVHGFGLLASLVFWHLEFRV